MDKEHEGNSRQNEKLQLNADRQSSIENTDRAKQRHGSRAQKTRQVTERSLNELDKKNVISSNKIEDRKSPGSVNSKQDKLVMLEFPTVDVDEILSMNSNLRNNADLTDLEKAILQNLNNISSIREAILRSMRPYHGNMTVEAIIPEQDYSRKKPDFNPIRVEVEAASLVAKQTPLERSKESTPTGGSLGAGKTERVHIALDMAELAAIDDYRFLARIPTRSAAIRSLIKAGLAAEKPKR